jgi:hypothetical protein
MDRDRQLEVVRSLTRHCIEAACPEKLSHFSEDFAKFVLTAGAWSAEENNFRLRLDQGIDTTLVAGMFFQVLLEAQRLPLPSPERVAFVRKEAKNYLVTRLAGQISLSQFFRLLNLIEENAQKYFETLGGEWLPARPVLAPATPPEDKTDRVSREDLRQALAALPMLPKGKRKLTHETLCQFLCDTQGNWFRLLDFEARFKINKKTAWAYLNLLLKTGILAHNGEKANKVR